MTPSFKIAAASLVVVLTCAWLPSQQLPLPATTASHGGGCHEDGKPAPNHAPGHDCCLTGHDVAMQQLSHVQRPDFYRNLHGNEAVVVPPVTVGDHAAKNVLMPPYPESPGATPLRI